MKFDHYTIRHLTEDDSVIFFQLVTRNRKRLEDFFAGTISRTQNLEETKKFVAERVAATKAKTYFPFVIIDEKTQDIIGFIDVKNIDRHISKAELGFYIDEKYAAKGIMTKALNLVIEHLHSDLGFNKLFLRTHPTNIATQKLAEKCGFQKEGLLRQDYKTTAGELVDLIYYGKLKSV